MPYNSELKFPAISPLQLDLTRYHAMDVLKKWEWK